MDRERKTRIGTWSVKGSFPAGVAGAHKTIEAMLYFSRELPLDTSSISFKNLSGSARP